MNAPRYFLIIPAAGSGSRMHAAVPKQYLETLGKPLLQHTLERMHAAFPFAHIIVAVAADDDRAAGVVANLTPELRLKLTLVNGGAERSQSVLQALDALSSLAAAQDWVLVHDAVRTCVHPGDVRKLISELAAEPAGGLLALPVRDTIKQAEAGLLVKRTLDRNTLWQAATPQMFRYGLLHDAMRQALERGLALTDEASAMEAAGKPVRIVPGRADNIKITYPEDLAFATALLQADLT